MALLYYALCVLCLQVTYLECNEFQKNGIDPNSIVRLEDSSLSLKHHSVVSRSVCDCGPNSDKCELKQDDKKVCTCKYKYRQVGDYCEPYCKEKWHCDQGSMCVNESCQCLKGTSGTFCEIVDECEGEKGILKCGDPEQVLCRFDQKALKTYCRCRIMEYKYDERTRRCSECDCDERFGSCSLVDGIKTCKCNPGTALKLEDIYSNKYTCQPCDCGPDSNNCSFERYSKECDCKDGYHQAGGMCTKCECGPHGKCIKDSWGCICDSGYNTFRTNDRKEIYCKECNCGKNGVCSFEDEVKKCKCNKKYAEREGSCVACQCYADDKVVDCFFEGKTQHCLCPKGYENGTFVCKDINECLDPKACPSDTVCQNTMGSYECSCKEGYEPYYEEGDPKFNGCKDIDECENEDMCPRVNTICTNYDGSYTCECEWGYEPVPPYESAIVAGCQRIRKKEADSPWKAGVIILGVVFGLCIAGLGIAILIRRRSNRQQPRVDTVLHNIR